MTKKRKSDQGRSHEESGKQDKHPDQKRAEAEEAKAEKLEKKLADKGAGPGPEDTPRGEADTEGNGAPADKEAAPFPVVGIGASAGGLEALESFVSHLPEESGIAFVLVTHSHPEHKTRLPELLERKTKVEIRTLEDGMKPEPGVVYIPPSDKDPVFRDGAIRLHQRKSKTKTHLPIDIFLRSLADEQGEMAGCVILSGTGTDGSEGVRAIKEKAGITVAQTKASARHSGMPESAVETGLVDFVLPPAEIAEQLIEVFRHPAQIDYKPDKEKKKEKTPEADQLQKILSLLEQRTRNDFSHYKKSTLIRRIERRMSITRSKTTEDYLKKLYRHDKEVETLFQNLLIGVTNFFRDPEVFDYLKKNVLCDLITRSPKEALRVWIPGCATGEEAYSVTISLKECMEELKEYRDIQIFATDLDERSIEKARYGYFPENIATDVSSERLERFFVREGEGYRVAKEIREPVVFAEQNVLRDPPFLNLDLLMCRNLLIYLEPSVQKRLIPLFHYALNSDGILFLGTSESVGDFTDLFKPVHKKYSIYQKQRTNGGIYQTLHFPRGEKKDVPKKRGFDGAHIHQEPVDDSTLASVTERTLLKEHVPPAVVTTTEGDILYIHGSTGQYLEPASGKAKMQIKDMARYGLRFRLSLAMRRATEEGREVREEGLQVKTNGEFVLLDLIVKPLKEGAARDCLLIVFEEKEFPVQQAVEEPEPGDECRHVAELEQELAKVQKDYQTALEDLETSNEELRSLNEEMSSANEEMQSTNEELESSREELQSLNEELNTVNSELYGRIQDSEAAYIAISDVLNSTRIALVFLDRGLRVERFTNEAVELVNLIEKDVGRPLDHISHKLEYEGLNETVRRVLQTLTPVDEEVSTQQGNWYRMRIMVRHTEEHEIQGVVITFINIDAQKEAMVQVEESEKKFRALVEASSEVLYRMNPDWSEMRQLHSRSFLADTKSPSRDWLRKYIPEEDQPLVLATIAEAIEKKHIFHLEHRVLREDGSVGWTLSRAVPIMDEDGEITEWFGCASDITARMENGNG